MRAPAFAWPRLGGRVGLLPVIAKDFLAGLQIEPPDAGRIGKQHLMARDDGLKYQTPARVAPPHLGVPGRWQRQLPGRPVFPEPRRRELPEGPSARGVAAEGRPENLLIVGALPRDFRKD